MTLVTIERVPLMRVGTWAASTGETSITREDLDAIVESYSTGQLDKAVIKIGHTDPRFDNPEWDGEPVYGQVSNLTVDDTNGGTLYGDYVNVPSDLAEKMPSAYPFRSVEISWGVKLKDAAGKVAQTFKAVLTGLALLGASAPAVKGLGDVQTSFSAAAMAADKAVVFSSFAFDGGHTQQTLRRTLQEQLDLLPREADGKYVDNWVEDYDDTHVFYQGAGGMVRQGYTVDPTSGAVVLGGDPVAVVEKRIFSPVPDTTPVPQAVSTANHSEQVAVPEGVTQAKSTKEVTPVANLKKYQEQLGLPDTATAEEILTALEAAQEAEAEAAAKPAEKKGAKKAAEPAPAEAEAGEPEAAPTTNASGAVAEPTPSITVSATAFSAVQETVARLSAENAAFKADADKKRRDGIISSALSEGRLHVAEEGAWRTALDENEGVTVSLLTARQPIFSVAEFGSALAPHAVDANKVVNDALIAAENALFRIGE